MCVCWNNLNVYLHRICQGLGTVSMGMTKIYSWKYYFNRCKDMSLGKFQFPFKAITMDRNHLTFCNIPIWVSFLSANGICQKQFPFDQKTGNASALGLANWMQLQTSTYCMRKSNKRINNYYWIIDLFSNRHITKSLIMARDILAWWYWIYERNWYFYLEYKIIGIFKNWYRYVFIMKV